MFHPLCFAFVGVACFDKRVIHRLGRSRPRVTACAQLCQAMEKKKTMWEIAVWGPTLGDFETLDANVASGLMNILHGDFCKRVFAGEEETSAPIPDS